MPDKDDDQPSPSSDPAPSPPDETDWKAEYERLQRSARKWEDNAKKNADAAKRLQEIEDSNKSEIEKERAAREVAVKEASDARLEARRLRVANRKGLSDVQSRRLVGETEEELEKDADELLESFKAAQPERDDLRRRPRESLRSGALPDAEPGPNVSELVEKMVAQSR